MAIANDQGLIAVIDAIIALCKSTFGKLNELINGLYELLIILIITLATIIIQFKLILIPKSIVL